MGVQAKARGVGIALAAVGSFVGGAKKRLIKNREMRQTLALGGHRLMVKHRDQPIVDGQGWGVLARSRHVVGKAGRVTPSHCLG